MADDRRQLHQGPSPHAGARGGNQAIARTKGGCSKLHLRWTHGGYRRPFGVAPDQHCQPMTESPPIGNFDQAVVAALRLQAVAGVTRRTGHPTGSDDLEQTLLTTPPRARAPQQQRATNHGDRHDHVPKGPEANAIGYPAASVPASTIFWAIVISTRPVTANRINATVEARKKYSPSVARMVSRDQSCSME